MSNPVHDYIDVYFDVKKQSLNGDVEKCIASNCPFPAILYCFSMIDLIMTIKNFNTKHGKVHIPKLAEKSKEAMIHYLSLDAGMAALLQDVYRHKLVHESEPPSLIRHAGMSIGWCMALSGGRNLVLEPLPSPRTAEVPPFLVAPQFGHLFHISIREFKDLILCALEKFKRDLKSTHSLERNFVAFMKYKFLN
jgi:hypothetical protein